MKRGINLYDGLFLLALYFKLSGTGPALNWVEVFLPYVIHLIVSLFMLIDSIFKFTELVKFFVMKPLYILKYRRAYKRAIKNIK